MRAQPAWMRRVRVGSVLAQGNGTWRVVRRVSRYLNGDLWGVTLAIRSCSWTGRCYTVLHYTDMKTRGFRLLPVRPRRLRSEMDQKIATAIHGDEHRGHYTLTCCDVEGMP